MAIQFMPLTIGFFLHISGKYEAICVIDVNEIRQLRESKNYVEITHEEYLRSPGKIYGKKI